MIVIVEVTKFNDYYIEKNSSDLVLILFIV